MGNCCRKSSPGRKTDRDTSPNVSSSRKDIQSPPLLSPAFTVRPPVESRLPARNESLSSISEHSSLVDIEFPPTVQLVSSVQVPSIVPPLDLGFVHPQEKVVVLEPVASWTEKDAAPSLTVSSSSEADKQDISRFSAFGVSSDLSKEGKAPCVEIVTEPAVNISQSSAQSLLEISASVHPSHFTVEDSLDPSQSPMISLRLATHCSSEATTQTHRVPRIAHTDYLVVLTTEGQTRLNDYRIVKELRTQGLVGSWYAADGHGRVTLWECNKNELGESALSAQARLLQRVYHCNILRLQEVIEAPDSEFGYLVFEGVRGRLAECSMGPEEAKEAFKALAHGVNYLHNVAQIVHLGIKPEALFLGLDGEVKLADFFAAKDMRLQDDICARTTDHRGRRSRIKQSYKPADILACGVTLYRLMFGALPFGQHDDGTRGRNTWRVPESIDPQLRDLLDGLFQRSPWKRLKISDVLRHPWLG